MSSRALRRLRGNGGDLDILGLGSTNLNLLSAEKKEDEEKDGLEEKEEEGQEELAKIASKKKNKKKKKTENTKVNLFDLLAESLPQSDEEETNKSEDDEGEEDVGCQDDTKQVVGTTAAASTASKAKKKKKKKGKTSADHVNVLPEPPEDEIEASLQEVNRLLGDPNSNSVCVGGESVIRVSATNSSLLTVDYRNLNPENELKRIFGAEVVRGERPSGGRGRRKPNQARRAWKLVQPKDNWHPTSGLGLSMASLGSGKGFTFVHSPAYQELQYDYYQAVQSGNPENIFVILRKHPYHIDTLIQMADFYRMNEDTQTAAECIEKALFGLESSFDTMFNMAAANCYLDYKRQENRALHICLFKHILNVGQRGCYRTAFEFCKLLISLDRKVDPLNAMYLVDFYAIRSKQYDFLVRLWQETKDSPSSVIERLNFALSVPLALFHKGEMKQADEMLQDRLLMYPAVLKPLLDKCSVQADRRVDKHAFFNSNEIHNEKIELGRIVKMVVERCYPCWKEADVMSWLECNVQKVMDIVDAGNDQRVKEYATRREARFKGASPCLLRHYLLCEISNLGLPRSTRNLDPVNLMVTDPFPPKDNITVYTPDRKRPNTQRNRSHEAEGQERNMLGLLLESLLPTYDPNAVAEEAAGAQAVYEQVEVEGAARGIPAPIHQGVNAIMDAMRALLTDLRGPDDVPAAPADIPPIEGQEDFDNERDWQEEQEEFDRR